jgi:hypothetical protein
MAASTVSLNTLIKNETGAFLFLVFQNGTVELHEGDTEQVSGALTAIEPWGGGRFTPPAGAAALPQSEGRLRTLPGGGGYRLVWAPKPFGQEQHIDFT